jgi:hypothetical protein
LEVVCSVRPDGANGAERGIVVQDGRMVELVAAGREPRAPAVKTFDASAHVVLPGLINTHHHFYQTLTRAVPAALHRELFPWLQALYPLWARLTPEAVELASTLAVAAASANVWIGASPATSTSYLRSAPRNDSAMLSGRAEVVSAVIQRQACDSARADNIKPVINLTWGALRHCPLSR